MAKRKIKKRNLKKELKFMNARIVIASLLALVLLCVVIANIANIIFIKGEEYSKRAYNQQVKGQIISSKRGTIYDANGIVLAQSISVDTISINPTYLEYSSGKKVEPEKMASAFVEIFGLSEEEALKKCSSKKSVEVIAKKVEKEKVTKLKEWMNENNITKGVNIDEDSKRYYPNDNLASNLLGFCNSDNKGISGIEERWDDALTGTNGKVVTASDRTGVAISDENEQYVPAENGSNLYLTIDINIQKIAEKYLEQAVNRNQAVRGGNVIIMNPQNGDIYAMVTNPDYNLNDPYNHEVLGYDDEDWDAIDSETHMNMLNRLWRNKAVSDLYEPGSTFKIITSSIGLEEDKVETDEENVFYCDGAYKVTEEDDPVKCWKYPDEHGYQSLREALENSCNPAFMQLGAKIGGRTAYKYYEAFELLDKIVGNDIAATSKPIFTPVDKLGPMEVATMSFGQRFSISPLQLISAVCAVCNNGTYVMPRIVKQIENTDTKTIENVEVNEVRQVISEDTAKKVKDMMRSVVESGTGRQAVVDGYSIGGKSGTSEPTKARQEEGYTASFISMAPTENPQVVCLVILYQPTNEYLGHQGGQTCGPVAGQIMSEVLPYLGVPTDGETVIEYENTSVAVPNVTNKSVEEAEEILDNLGFNVEISGEEGIVVEQTPKSGIYLEPGSTVQLYTAKNAEKTMVEVPDLLGKSAQEAEATLKNKGLNMQQDGSNSGVVVSQDPPVGSTVEKNSAVRVTIKSQISGG